MRPLVYLVDDDDLVRCTFELILREEGLEVHAFANPLSFISAFDASRHGCVVLDVQMPDMTGIELQHRLSQFKPPPVLLLISGWAGVPVAVEAMRAGALDFLTKPVDERRLLAGIQKAFELDLENRRLYRERERVVHRYATLTRRERQILADILQGKMNKTMALDRGISIRTVDHHRARLMEKMAVGSVAELVQLVAQLPFDPKTEEAPPIAEEPQNFRTKIITN